MRIDKTWEQKSFAIAKGEIPRILTKLNLNGISRDKMLSLYKQVWYALEPERVYRDPKHLIPLVIYFYVRFQKISIPVEALIKYSRTTKSLFYCFVFQILETLYSNTSENTKRWEVFAILESEPERKEFFKFLRHVCMFSFCPFCSRPHKKEYVIKSYFKFKL